MKNNNTTILSTRILSKENVRLALQHGIVINEKPFISTSLIHTDTLKKTLKGFLQQRLTVVFTSRNAVLAFDQIANAKVAWQIFCIGHGTKLQVLKTFGEDSVSGTADNAQALSELIIQQADIKKITFFCGNQRRDDLPELLSANQIEVNEITVYETLETPEKISADKYDGFLFFSPSAVSSFFKMNSIESRHKVFSIGKTTAAAVQLHIKKEIQIAESPTEDAMMEQVITHFNMIKIK